MCQNPPHYGCVPTPEIRKEQRKWAKKHKPKAAKVAKPPKQKPFIGIRNLKLENPENIITQHIQVDTDLFQNWLKDKGWAMMKMARFGDGAQKTSSCNLELCPMRGFFSMMYEFLRAGESVCVSMLSLALYLSI